MPVNGVWTVGGTPCPGAAWWIRGQPHLPCMSAAAAARGPGLISVAPHPVRFQDRCPTASAPVYASCWPRNESATLPGKLHVQVLNPMKTKPRCGWRGYLPGGREDGQMNPAALLQLEEQRGCRPDDSALGPGPAARAGGPECKRFRSCAPAWQIRAAKFRAIVRLGGKRLQRDPAFVTNPAVNDSLHSFHRQDK